jgi:hypothetical protein
MTKESVMIRHLIGRAVTIGTPLDCVGFGLCFGYMGWSWQLAIAGGAAAGSLAILVARSRRARSESSG